MDAKTLAEQHPHMRDADMPIAERIKAATERIASGVDSLRVPVEATDPDIVLHDCRVLIERQAAELAALRSDAERYRWLRDCASGFDAVGDPDNLISVWYGRPDKFSNAPTLDEAIDAARAGGAKHGA